MTLLVVGLAVFLGTHSMRIVANDWRSATIARRGERAWKLAFSILSLLGLVLIVYGYDQARQATAVLYTPPVWSRHAAAALVLLSFVLIAAAYVRGTRIKARVGHPMVLGVKVWAFAHLLANGTLADVVLFGAFLAWAVLDYIASRRRDRSAGVVYPVGPPSRDAIAIAAGVAAWALFAFVLHGPLIGVRPLP
jgi:uncharacterized membrane protein